jgi:hypothetical protein
MHTLGDSGSGVMGFSRVHYEPSGILSVKACYLVGTGNLILRAFSFDLMKRVEKGVQPNAFISRAA